MEPPSTFPKMEQQQFDLHELLSLEDHHHLHFQRSFEDAIIPTFDNNLFDFSTNYLLQYPTFSYDIQPKMNLENLDFSDFQSWIECPPLSEDTTNNAWQPISQLPPSPLPCINDTSNNKPFSFDNYNNKNVDHQFLLPNTNFNDQTLAVIVAEGYTMPRKGIRVKVEDSVVSEDEEIMMRIKGDDYDDDYLKVKKIESINFEEIKKYFDKPIQLAAKELNVGLTVLKKRCRELNIKRWPHRKIKSLEALIRNVKELGMVEMVEVLEEHKKKLQTMPGLELTKETKKLRQSCFKANYKKRRALNLSQIN